MKNSKSKYYNTINLFLIIFLFLTTGISKAQDENTPKPEIGIYEKLGETIPDDIILTNEYGQQVNFKTLINKPTIISLVYFRCPGICSPLLNGVRSTVDRSDMEPGKDYNLITISFDQNEGYQMAAEKKENYLGELKRKIPGDSWRFLTGDSLNIQKISNALGFKFQRKDADFIHGAAIMVVSPKGKIVRYLYGTDYLPFDFKMAVTEATEGKVVPSISKIMKMCFSFDPEGRKYVLNVTRIAGGGIIILLCVFVVLLNIKKKKTKINV
ncbi:MAG: SCO family protein [Ignavibacteria bacterium]|nr:SCO family protein [Ignavibacteria bacterium]